MEHYCKGSSRVRWNPCCGNPINSIEQLFSKFVNENKNSLFRTFLELSAECKLHNMAEVNYSVVFSFEKNFDEPSFHSWMLANWSLSFWYAGAYIVLIFGSKYYMNKRPRFEIRALLALWSSILGVFSVFGAARTIPEFVHVLQNFGFEHSMCNPSFYHGPVAFWCCMFTISKVFELGDTIFIVLRKQQLIFLHWYHHVTVLIYVWYTYSERAAPGRWFMVMNYTVHSFMYTYYALRAMRINIPKFVNIVITSMQLIQMIVGSAVNLWTYQLKVQGHHCQQSYSNLQCSLLMYLSYFILFIYFFYNAYLKPKNEECDFKHKSKKGR